MNITLTKKQAWNLISFVEQRLSEKTCDHSLTYTTLWSEKADFDYVNLFDILEENGSFCDCEVVFNLPNDRDIVLPVRSKGFDRNNPWKIPISFELPDSDKTYTNFLISRHSKKNNCYSKEGELLVPAPKGAEALKRVRKSVHFFIGLETSLPSEFGFVQNIGAVTAKEFAKKVRESGQKNLQLFLEKEAAFYLSRLEKLKQGNGVATHFSKITGLTSKREELKIHKVIFRK